MFEPLPGFRDFYPEDCLKRDFLFSHWRRWARRFDFQPYDIPTLEPLELLTQKAGQEIIGQLFHFTDQGGRHVALRPELTTSLARMIGSKASTLKRPVKWFNVAENFRYERQQKGRLRSHFQFNADIFGEQGVSADAEVIALLLQSLSDLGLKSSDFQLRLSDRGLWALFLESLGFAGDRGMEVLSVIDKMERMDADTLRSRLQPYFNAAVDDFLASVASLKCQRELDGVDVLFRRLLPTGDLRIRAQQRVDEWRQLLRILNAMGLAEFVRVDLGIVRGLAYYTGFVFEAFLVDADGQSLGRALAGGGRFDHLVSLLGYPDMPAVGFGMGDVVLGDALAEKGLLPPLVDAPDLFAIFADTEDMQAAMADAARLRARGYRIRYPLKQVGFSKQFKLAGQSGASFALIYGSEERADAAVKVRDLRSGRESLASRSTLLASVHEWFQTGIPEDVAAQR